MKPILFSILGVNLYSYPIFLGISLTCFVSYLNTYSESLREKKIIVYPLLLILSFIGAKLTFLITLPKFMKGLVSTNDFFYGGGFVFYGGLFGLLFGFLILKKAKQLKTIDWRHIIPAILLAHAVGRIGCFLSGCCFGLHTHGVNIPVQVIESGFLFIMFALFHFRLRKRDMMDFQFLTQYLFFYAIFRIIIERFRGDVIRGVYQNLSSSQWISAFILIVLFLLQFFRKNQIKA